MVKRFGCSLLGVLVSLCVFAGAAGAVAPGAGWSLDSVAVPSSFSESQNAHCNTSAEPAPCDSYRVTVANVGQEATDGSTIYVSDVLPAGVTVQRISLHWAGVDFGSFFCHVVSGRALCEWPAALAPGETLFMTVYVTVDPGAPGSLVSTVSVSGGGAAGVLRNLQNTNSLAEPPFGVSTFEQLIAGVDGAPDTQAGAHPYQLTANIALNSAFRNEPREDPEGNSGHGYTSVQDPRDVVVDLPVGFVGSALAAPTCTLAQLTSGEHCPQATTVGSIVSEPGGIASVGSPLYNIVPEHGVAAELGYYDKLKATHVLYASVAPTQTGYVLRVTSHEIPQVSLAGVVLTVYGNPAARDGSGNTPVAFFTNPSDCSGEPLTTALHVDSWQNPGSYNPDGSPNLSDPAWAAGSTQTPPVTGCDLLHFEGSIGAQPETAQADTPSGLNVELKIPQNENPSALATPPLKKAVVTLPAGLAIDPSAAGGLQACTLAQIGLGSNMQPACPEASKIGSVEVETPALAGVLHGSMYLASQGENPFGTLLAGYAVVDDPTTGVLIKLPGRIDPDQVTGQLVATFDQAPQFPFSDLRLHIFGGPRAPLTTPQACGTYTTSAVLTPWSAPDSGPPTNASDSFPINTGCVSGFNPGFVADTPSNQAGGFSAFTATFSRTDQDQNLAEVSVTTPPGLLGLIKSVERCPEPQAAQGACGPNSLIGHTTVAAGAGPDPFWVQGGQVFLTGPYKGAPFGLSVVVPAVAGPFNLGNVVVRAAIHVDPHTAQITVTSDPLPTILQGIPLDVRTVNVTIDRPGFMFNPTSCDPLTVNGTVTSTPGAAANVSSRFQAASCAGLAFKPVFTVSTQARTSKKNGASLDVKVVYPQGAEANIRGVAVTLPKQLPSRLSTIQQACPEAAFNANPASCPAGSDIGIGVAHTPVLAGPVSGPAYLVSHGGAAFPDLVLILQGEGVKLELIGSINIKKSITSSTFASVPDAPISSFELTLPEGPHSGLAAVLPAKAKGNLCATSLTMPTTITGQNGAVIKQNTKIAVTGCAKAKKKAKKRKKGKK
jgi:uncharacterized repeat protein (TIGR01451 family)